MTGVQIFAPLTNIAGPWGQATVRKILQTRKESKEVEADSFSITGDKGSPKECQDLYLVHLIFTID